jgi:hypothetical protein
MNDGGERTLGGSFYPSAEPAATPQGPAPARVAGQPPKPGNLGSAFYSGGQRDDIANPMAATPRPAAPPVAGEPQPQQSGQRRPTSAGEALYGSREPDRGGAPPMPGSQSAARPAETEPAVDAGQQQAAVDQTALMDAFVSETRAMGIEDETDRSRLLEMHADAVTQQHQALVADWRQQAEREFTPHQISDLRSRFDRALGRDAAAAETRRLIAWSGLGSNPAFLKSLSRILARSR